jgi:hypothetical protein
VSCTLGLTRGRPHDQLPRSQPKALTIACCPRRTAFIELTKPPENSLRPFGGASLWAWRAKGEGACSPSVARVGLQNAEAECAVSEVKVSGGQLEEAWRSRWSARSHRDRRCCEFGTQPDKGSPVSAAGRVSALIDPRGGQWFRESALRPWRSSRRLHRPPKSGHGYAEPDRS